MRHTRAEQFHRPKAALLLLVVAILGISGCSSLPQEVVEAPTSAVPVASNTAEMTTQALATTAAAYKPATETGPAENVPVPVLPEKAKEFSKEGLIAFTEYWYQTLGYAFETGDPDPMMAITGAACPSCEAMKVAVVPWHSEGRWIMGGQMMVLSATTSFVPLEDGTYQVTALVRQQHLKFYRGDGTLADDRGQKPSVGDSLGAVYDAGRWKALDIQRLKG
ncbi:hypothetical protein CVS29_00250 [Arthrobacter psychrochitiniphilus]|uniref:DUF6318 domain-containing protein n=2 Tax=Arthrobacter TaxID=1663 RepID=A0A2V3DW18_9MICC|nr:hypothetical protein CVS29_00250 [Arthrobacter psychrochitiniphilus]